MKLPDVTGAIIAVDCESSGLDIEFDRPSIISVARLRPDGSIRGRSYAFDQGLQADKLIGFERMPIQKHILWGSAWDDVNLGEAEWKKLLTWISQQQIVGANFKFDLHMLYLGHRVWGGGVDLSANLIWDVNIATMLLEPRELVGLKETAARAWGEDAKAEQMAVDAWFRERKIPAKSKNPARARRYDFLPWDVIEPYATQDAVLTLRLYQRQQAMFEEVYDAEMQRVFRREMALALVLWRMERRGIGFDAEACAKAAQTLSEARNELARGLPFKPGIGAAKGFFFGAEGTAIRHRQETPSGQAKLDEEMLGRMVAEDVEWAEEYQRLRNVDSALAKWYRTWPRLCGPDGRLRVVYGQTNVRTGRLSGSRVQLQAIPHDSQLPAGVASLRSFFRARRGYELWELDLSQAEIRVAAYVSKCRPMIETLRMGSDVHGATATRIWGVKEGDADWTEKRYAAKHINFGINYGAGPRTIRAHIRKLTGMEFELPQVEQWVKEYRQTYRAFSRTAERLQNQIEDRGWVQLVGGRRRWFLPGEVTYKAFNAVIQGSVSEIMKEAMIDVEARHPGVLLLQIHDSMVVEVPESKATEIVADIARRLEKLFTLRFNRVGRDDLHVDFPVDVKKWEGPTASVVVE